MNHGGKRDVVLHGGNGILIHAEKVADIQRRPEILPSDRVNEPLHPFAALHMKSVIFHTGCNAEGFCVIGDLRAGFGQFREIRVEIPAGGLGGRTPSGVVPHPRHTETHRDVHFPFHPLDLLAERRLIRLNEVRSDRITGKIDSAILRGSADLRTERLVLRQFLFSRSTSMCSAPFSAPHRMMSHSVKTPCATRLLRL